MMKIFLVLFLLVFVPACSLQMVDSKPIKSETSPIKAKQQVLVELFTSEGCSSCPPADRALALLQTEQPNSEAEIITLAFHVDYWNNLGWKDEFSAPLFTQRQHFYAKKFGLQSAYTPQMVVDGKYEFVGSNLGKAQKSISDAAKAEKAAIEISEKSGVLKIIISELPEHQDATVYVAIAEDNISTDVKRGENAGSKLEHVSVVRQLNMAGKIEKSENALKIDYPLDLQPSWKRENLKIAVFLQEIESRRIIGLKSLKIE